MPDEKAQFSIYKINLFDFLDGENFTVAEITKKLSERIEGEGYLKAKLTKDNIGGYSIMLFCNDRKADGLWSLVKSIIKDTQKEEIETKLKTKNSDLIILIYKDNECYGISGGSGYLLLQKISDEEFPIEIFKKSCKTTCRYAASRNTSGYTYYDYQVYRRMYQFGESEVFGKIRGDIGGEIRDDSELKEYLGETGVKALMKKYSFKVSKQMTIEELVALIKKVSSVYNRELTPQEELDFSFLNTLRPIKIKEKKEKLIDDFLKEKIIKYIKGETDKIDVEFCSPNDIGSFFCGSKYEIMNGQLEEEFNDYGVEKILDYLKDTYSSSSDQEILNAIKEFKLKITYSEADIAKNTRRFDLYKCFHGEFIVDDTCYFLVDGTVYKVYEEYIKSLKKYFLNEIILDEKLIINTIPFANWTSTDEGAFNRAHMNNEEDGFLCCDRIFYDGKGGIELFDLIYEDGKNIYLIHVKEGFDAKTRDACSQIQNSADFINRDKLSNYECVRGLYKNITKYKGSCTLYRQPVREYFKNNISEEAFVNKFKKKNIIYTLAFMVKEIPNESTINKFKSNIARNELILTKNYFNQKHKGALKITFITPTT